ncbi:MAG: hypothetical protein OEZ39_08785 [Gammaproteobacteria bacterium]|nr:hypothetical protein [Gammaproteobacteria bacterium]MDH5651959.1 hypothetical protein [Gammaproteobacteria bacterium]
MSRVFLNWYQYLAPLILAPLSFWLWWRTYQGDLQLVLLAWLLPILYAYIVPAVGTNVLKVWEFDTRFRLGRFRPQHGFVFGSATATLVWLCHTTAAQSIADILRFAFIVAAVLGFWNVIYDIKAIRSGMLKVYNQPWADGQGSEAITMDYAPWFFAGFGAAYGAAIALAEWLTQQHQFTTGWFVVYFISALLVCMAVPVLGYRQRSFRVHGHSGCRPVARQAE